MQGDKTLDGYQKKKYVCKLLFIFLLGHDIDFGHMEAVNLLSSNKYTEKQIVSPSIYNYNLQMRTHKYNIMLAKFPPISTIYCTNSFSGIFIHIGVNKSKQRSNKSYQSIYQE